MSVKQIKRSWEVLSIDFDGKGAKPATKRWMKRRSGKLRRSDHKNWVKLGTDELQENLEQSYSSVAHDKTLHICGKIDRSLLSLSLEKCFKFWLYTMCGMF